MKDSENSTDLRVKKTCTLLWNALEDLLIQPGKEFSSITVNEICERAMVHRTTFYKHFADKYDLLYLGFMQLNAEFRKINLEEGIEKPFQTMEKNPKRKIVDSIVRNQKNDEAFNNLLKNYVKKMLKEAFLELDRRGKNFPVPIEIIAEFYSGVLSSLSTWWAQNGSNISAAQMDDYFHQMINEDFFAFSGDGPD